MRAAPLANEQLTRKVDVGSGEVSYGVDRGHDRKPETQANAEGGHSSAGDFVDDYGPRPCEDKQEGADKLCGLAPKAGHE